MMRVFCDNFGNSNYLILLISSALLQAILQTVQMHGSVKYLFFILLITNFLFLVTYV